MTDNIWSTAISDDMIAAYEAKDVNKLLQMAQELLDKAESYDKSRMVCCPICGEKEYHGDKMHPSETYALDGIGPYVCFSCLDTTYDVWPDYRHPIGRLISAAQFCKEETELILDPDNGDDDAIGEAQTVLGQIYECEEALKELAEEQKKQIHK